MVEILIITIPIALMVFSLSNWIQLKIWGSILTPNYNYI